MIYRPSALSASPDPLSCHLVAPGGDRVDTARRRPRQRRRHPRQDSARRHRRRRRRAAQRSRFRRPTASSTVNSPPHQQLAAMDAKVSFSPILVPFTQPHSRMSAFSHPNAVTGIVHLPAPSPSLINTVAHPSPLFHHCPQHSSPSTTSCSCPSHQLRQQRPRT